MNGIVEIPLTQGVFALVDAADAPLVTGYSWCLTKVGRRRYATAYVRGSAKIRPQYVTMHRLLLNAPNRMDVDHIDGNGLNNTRANLRLASRAQNMANVARVSHGRSKHKGVTFVARLRLRPWRAQIMVNGKHLHLGQYATEVEAAKAYDAAARLHFGEFARTNFPAGDAR